jgi:hypothetical protein
VQKFSQVVLIVLGTIIALGTIVLLGANLYVQSQGTQARIQQELSQRLGTTLNVRRVSVTPWGGLKLSGITIPEGSAGSPNFLEARTFGLRIRLLSLFARRLVITKVSLIDPKVIWPQNASGKWRLPGLPEDNRGNAPVAPAQPIGRSRAEKSPELEAETPAMKLPEIHARANDSSFKNKNVTFVPEIRRVSLSGGDFRFLDRSGNFVAAFEGLEFRSAVRNAVALRGSARVAKISLRNRFFLDQLKSPLQYDPTSLDLPQISAHAGGGDIAGRFSMQPEMEDSPFTVEVRFRNVQADRIVTDAGGPKGVVQGKLEGSLNATGKTADPNALTGAGEIVLRDGQVQQYSLLVALGQVLQIEELMQLHLEQAEAKYHITPGVVTVDDLILHSPNIRLSASGTITFKGKVQLDSRLAINEKIRAQLFKPIRANFQPTDEPGYFAVDFEVGGTIDRPKSNLLERVVGRDLKDLVNSFWSGKKTERPKKKRSAEATPREGIASPSPSPASGKQTAATATPLASP